MSLSKTSNIINSNSKNNKRILINTVLLYFRMLILLGVSLYTSRIVLKNLGVEDFGIYNVVGGIVIMFSFLNSSMSSATQRFISFELGSKNNENLQKIFIMCVNIHLLIALTIFFLAETIGLWFLNTYLVIPAERMVAANWVYQFSILSFLFTIISVPYNAFIIANERMNVYAYVGIIEVALKLLTVFSLAWFGFDKLKLYGVLIFIVTVFIWLIYKVYCFRNFKDTKYRFLWDKVLFKTLMNYSGWNLFGSMAGVTMGQGINILLNLFFNPVINAARAISYQVYGAINGFVSNFQIAIKPQIVISFAKNDIEHMHQLIFQGAKYSYFLLYIISLPLIFEMEFVLKSWLNTVPDYTVLFCRLILINALIDCVSGPLITAAQATGKIKKYQIIIGSLLLLNLPVSYLLLSIGMGPQTTIYTSIIISIFCLFSRLLILKPMIAISISKFFNEVIYLVVLISLSSLILPSVIVYYVNPSNTRIFFVVAASTGTCIISIYYIGLNSKERKFFKTKLKQLSKKYH